MRLPQSPPDHFAIFRKSAAKAEHLSEILQVGATDSQGRYLHWDEVRFRKPPDGLSVEEYWAGMKFGRVSLLKPTKFTDDDGKPFLFSEPDGVRRALHEIDSRTRGHIAIDKPIINPDTKRSYLVKSLIEEAFNSSLIEGAATTRQAAKEMVRDGRPPRSVDERMVINNFRAMEFIQEIKEESLTESIILELHKIITEDTLENPKKAGKYRTKSDIINVVDDRDNTILHNPPPANELRGRVKKICDFANEGNDGPRFIHPLIRAIILHFMLAYDHPFVDGNGRTARALFYWHAIRNKYWLLEFTSISRVIAKSKTQYARAYLHTETDENDMTYFIVYHLKILEQSISELEDYLRRKIEETNELESLLRGTKYEKIFNYRQMGLLKYSVQHPGAILSIKQHQNLSLVSYHTARSDLEFLAARNLLRKATAGRESIYLVPQNILDRLRRDPKS